MIERVEVVEYGRPAGEVLAAAIASAKDGVALAPVTVIVPSNLAGLSARRRLGAAGGLANVAFVTPPHLAQQLAADQLLERRPLTAPTLGAAVRLALRDTPGPFADIRDHVATEVALAALHAELATVDDATLGHVLDAGGRAAHTAISLHRSIGSHLIGYHDDADLARAATNRTDLAAALAPLGHVVWHLPQPVSAPLVGLVRAVLAERPSSVVVGLTGAPGADRPVEQVCARAGVALPERSTAPPTAPSPPTASDIVSVTDADEEVRAVVRRIVALAEDGVPLDRIGVFHPTRHPYVGLLHQQLDAAGLPSNGPSRRRLHESVAGRTLLAALDLPAQGWRRDRVMAMVSAAPTKRFDGGPTFPTAWESISRAAGVVSGVADWRTKLASHRGRLTRRAGSTGSDVDHERTIEAIEALEQFVSDLSGAIAEVHRSDGWAARSAAAHRLLVSLLGPGHLHGGWPDDEQLAFERVEDTLARLAAVDAIEPDAGPDVFTRALRVELDVPQPRRGRFGEGILFGPLDAAVGHDLDAVFVLGCVEGLLPGARRDDSLLPDSVRRLAGGALELRADRLHHQHRAFLAALASAPPHRRILTTARSDLRGNRHALPSRWLLDSAGALAGRTVHSTDFARLDASGVHHVPSFAAGLVETAVAATLGERDLIEAAAAVATAGSVTGGLAHLPLDAAVRRGLDAQSARRSGAFTPWDGNLSGLPVERAGDRPWSPTRLETWAACGMRYAFTYVLGLGERDDPERVLDLDPLDRGSALHRVLELFIGDVIGADRPEPGEPWSETDEHRLLEIAVEVLDDYERRGRTGRSLHWQLTAADLVAALFAFLQQDNAHRASTNSHPTHVELVFGRAGAQPVILELDDGRRLAFSGAADRVDADVDDPGALHVSDYKSGKGAKFKGLDDDPVQGGTTLQLGIYAEAAAQLLGATSVASRYWIINTDPRFRRLVGYTWTPDRRQRLLDVVGAIVAGIDGGLFPAVPGDWNTFRSTHDNCTYCEFDRVCPRDRGEQHTAKAGAVELRVRAPLAAVAVGESA